MDNQNDMQDEVPVEAGQDPVYESPPNPEPEIADVTFYGYDDAGYFTTAIYVGDKSDEQPPNSTIYAPPTAEGYLARFDGTGWRLELDVDGMADLESRRNMLIVVLNTVPEPDTSRYSAIERATWPFLYDEAKSYLADESTLGTFLEELSIATQRPLKQTAQSIVAKEEARRAELAEKAAAVVAMRYRIEDATTADDLPTVADLVELGATP